MVLSVHCQKLLGSIFLTAWLLPKYWISRSLYICGWIKPQKQTQRCILFMPVSVITAIYSFPEDLVLNLSPLNPDFHIIWRLHHSRMKRSEASFKNEEECRPGGMCVVFDELLLCCLTLPRSLICKARVKARAIKSENNRKKMKVKNKTNVTTSETCCCSAPRITAGLLNC